MTPKIRPLTGQALVRLIAPEKQTRGGIFLPDNVETPHGEKAEPYKAVIEAVGPWQKTADGFAIVPEVKRGDKVLISAYTGQELSRGISDRLKLVDLTNILAVLE